MVYVCMNPKVGREWISGDIYEGIQHTEGANGSTTYMDLLYRCMYCTKYIHTYGIYRTYVHEYIRGWLQECKSVCVGYPRSLSYIFIISRVE